MNFSLNNKTGTKRCNKFTNTSPAPVPFIYSVYSVNKPYRGGLYLIIIGINFRDYSVVKFENLVLPVIFYSSESVMVRIPETISSSISYTVQLVNGYYESNIVYYTL
uniref:IPT/TIG domain-containing protein n=1 Tax=viral metagenome TaxID=1070528 RepID=A0A6C0E2L5_9ZZZZ